MSTQAKASTMSALEAARALNVSLCRIYTVLREGRLKADRVDGEWRIPERAIREYVARREARRAQLTLA
jgi:excisionase family DNA binding protein